MLSRTFKNELLAPAVLAGIPVPLRTGQEWGPAREKDPVVDGMTLALAAAMMLGAATGANAIDFKAKGQWIMSFDYGMHGNFGDSKASSNSGFGKNEDEFEARQRVRLQLDAVASEALSGTVFFEIGDQVWGQDSTGGALGADKSVVELKRAYIDWMVPQTDLKVRMGIQGLALPSFTTTSSTKTWA